jgi:predicted nucleic acid-binding protein
MAVLVDTSVLLAAAFSRDANHDAAAALLRALAREARIVAAPVLSELFYLTAARISYARAVEIFARTRAAFQIESLTALDMIRMQAIMEQYRDAQFDFADVAMMALAERLHITRICTLDRRDFGVFRPAHCEYFELLP